MVKNDRSSQFFFVFVVLEKQIIKNIAKVLFIGFEVHTVLRLQV